MSRPRSSRAASAPAARASGRPGVYVQAPRNDVYTYLLLVALLAMITGCALLAMVLKRYDFKTKVAAVTQSQPALTTILKNSGSVLL